ncbi:MAG: 5'/3'-nucleotidase SurE [Bacillota bacterium]|nr:5'/3'-nucleotidase SurE [Bacillota bacterium]
MRILLTNDDGVYARGIQALASELSSLGEVILAAPERQQSGTGHSITVFDPIRVMSTTVPGALKAWIVSGTPVDCVKLALVRLVGKPVDLVVSGINHGANLGTDVLYSGTVSAAAEGVIMGVPAIAVSLNDFGEKADFNFAARFTRQVVQYSMEQGISKTTLLNVNIPALPGNKIKGVQVTKLGNRNYENLFEERKDPRGNSYYWMGGGVMKEEQDQESDVKLVEDGFISITPIHLDLTDYKLIEKYKKEGQHLQNLLP